MAARTLTDREEELVAEFARCWAARSEPFVLAADEGFSDARWSASVPAPKREEVRSLFHADLLSADRSQGPAWVFYPTDRLLGRVGQPNPYVEALADPDARLATVLEATVDAHAQDPSRPLTLTEYQQVAVVLDERWVLPPQALGFHDLDPLQRLGLVGTRRLSARTTEFWPTPSGRQARRDPAGYVEVVADRTEDPARASRLRAAAQKLRLGDVGVAGAGSGLGHILRALADSL